LWHPKHLSYDNPFFQFFPLTTPFFVLDATPHQLKDNIQNPE